MTPSGPKSSMTGMFFNGKYVIFDLNLSKILSFSKINGFGCPFSESENSEVKV
jgi:hypothetical protein